MHKTIFNRKDHVFFKFDMLKQTNKKQYSYVDIYTKDMWYDWK